MIVCFFKCLFVLNIYLFKKILTSEQEICGMFGWYKWSFVCSKCSFISSTCLLVRNVCLFLLHVCMLEMFVYFFYMFICSKCSFPLKVPLLRMFVSSQCLLVCNVCYFKCLFVSNVHSECEGVVGLPRPQPGSWKYSQWSARLKVYKKNFFWKFFKTTF